VGVVVVEVCWVDRQVVVVVEVCVEVGTALVEKAMAAGAAMVLVARAMEVEQLAEHLVTLRSAGAYGCAVYPIARGKR